MNARLPRLREAALAARELRHRLDDRLLYRMAWLPGQQAFLSCPDKRKMFRAGNQSQGKTWAGLGEGIFRAQGDHPFLDVPPPPTHGWVICASFPQSVAIQKKLWELVPKDVLADDQRPFDPQWGFSANAPIVKFKNGSTITFKTTHQNALNLASATIDWVLFDEPPTSQRVYAEVKKRLQKMNGTLMVTMTPVNAAVDWIREEAEAERITDLHFPLKPENLIPVGRRHPITLGDGTPCDAEWIQEVIDDSFEHEVPVVVHGEWEMRVEGHLFKAWRDTGKSGHVQDELPDDVDFKLLLGVDHGKRVGAQNAIIVLVDEAPLSSGALFPDIYVWDEITSKEETTTEDDAANILEALDRWGWAWNELDGARGDRSLGHRGSLQFKSNLDLETEIGKQLGIRTRVHPRIHTVKRGEGKSQGSVYTGEKFLHKSMVRHNKGIGTFWVHPRCIRLIECFNKYDGNKNSEHKHLIDALRYALEPYIFRQRRQGPVTEIRTR